MKKTKDTSQPLYSITMQLQGNQTGYMEFSDREMAYTYFTMLRTVEVIAGVVIKEIEFGEIV
jgi:hypothetical protein